LHPPPAGTRAGGGGGGAQKWGGAPAPGPTTTGFQGGGGGPGTKNGGRDFFCDGIFSKLGGNLGERKKGLERKGAGEKKKQKRTNKFGKNENTGDPKGIWRGKGRGGLGAPNSPPAGGGTCLERGQLRDLGDRGKGEAPKGGGRSTGTFFFKKKPRQGAKTKKPTTGTKGRTSVFGVGLGLGGRGVDGKGGGRRRGTKKKKKKQKETKRKRGGGGGARRNWLVAQKKKKLGGGRPRQKKKGGGGGRIAGPRIDPGQRPHGGAGGRGESPKSLPGAGPGPPKAGSSTKRKKKRRGGGGAGARGRWARVLQVFFFSRGRGPKGERQI